MKFAHLSRRAAFTAQLQRKLKRRSVRRRAVRVAFITVNTVLLLAVLFFVLHARTAGDTMHTALNTLSKTVATNPLDQLSSADIAVTVSRMTDMSEATAIKNTAESQDVALSTAPAINNVVAKPDVVATAFKSNKDIQTYTVVAGDTVSSIAAKFNVTSDSIRWSNGLSGDTVGVGTKLSIPPVGYSGIVYIVKSGDTLDSIAQKYKADKSQLIAANDAEISGIQVGEQIIIPNGQQPVQSYASSYSGYGGFAWGGSAVYGYNGYDYGYCTWWVAQRRAQVGDPIPSNLGNASSWYWIASGVMSTGRAPKLHAAAVTSMRGEGHVVFVEGVNGDGSIVISEMNHLGWDVQDTETIPAAQAASYYYIY